MNPGMGDKLEPALSMKKNMGPCNANKYLCYPGTDGVFQVCTAPNNNASINFPYRVMHCVGKHVPATLE